MAAAQYVNELSMQIRYPDNDNKNMGKTDER